jgi:hypothetical protein
LNQTLLCTRGVTTVRTFPEREIFLRFLGSRGEKTELLAMRSSDGLSLICHLTFMKLLHALLAVGAASVLPTASADERAQAPKPFTIAFSTEIAPVSHGELRYPAYAGTRNLSGSCEVNFAISTAGKPDAIRVGKCSSEAFRFAAKATVDNMSFAPRASVAEDVALEIRWTLDQPSIQTASLD